MDSSKKAQGALFFHRNRKSTAPPVESNSSSHEHDDLDPIEPKTTAEKKIQEVSQVRPWVRYWARMLDIMLFSLPVGFTIGILFPNSFQEPGSENLLEILFLFLWVCIEATLLANFGTTPGKWLFNIKFISTSSTSFSIEEAFARSLKVWWRGLGIGLPIVSLVTLSVAYYKLTENRRTSWDKDLGIIIKHERIGATRIFAAIVFFFLYFLLIGAASAV